MMVRAKSTGMEVNKDLTSKETMISSLDTVCDLEMTTSPFQKFISLWHAHKSRATFSRNEFFLSARSRCCF